MRGFVTVSFVDADLFDHRGSYDNNYLGWKHTKVEYFPKYVESMLVLK
jgi:hypothetical protein